MIGPTLLMLCLPFWGGGIIGEPSGLRPAPLRIHVWRRSGQPTLQALLQKVREAAPDLLWSIASGDDPTAWAPDIPRADRGERSVLLILDSRPKPPRGVTAPVVLVASGPPARDGGPAALTLQLAVEPAAVAEARELFLPRVERVGVLGGVSSVYGVVAPTCLTVDPVGRDPADLVAALAPQVDAILIPDLTALVGEGELIVQQAQTSGLPVISLAPWLDQSGACLGVVPDLDGAARLLVLALRQAAIPGVALPPRVVTVPSLRILDLDSLTSLGLAVPPARLVEADRCRLDPGKGGS